MIINLLNGVPIKRNANLRQKECKKIYILNKISLTVNVETHFVLSVEKNSIGQLTAKCFKNGKLKTLVKVKT